MCEGNTVKARIALLEYQLGKNDDIDDRNYCGDIKLKGYVILLMFLVN